MTEYFTDIGTMLCQPQGPLVSPQLTIVLVAQWLEHPSSVRKVVGLELRFFCLSFLSPHIVLFSFITK